jgi:hypothetical protein
MLRNPPKAGVSKHGCTYRSSFETALRRLLRMSSPRANTLALFNFKKIDRISKIYLALYSCRCI